MEDRDGDSQETTLETSEASSSSSNERSGDLLTPITRLVRSELPSTLEMSEDQNTTLDDDVEMFYVREESNSTLETSAEVEACPVATSSSLVLSEGLDGEDATTEIAHEVEKIRQNTRLDSSGISIPSSLVSSVVSSSSSPPLENAEKLTKKTSSNISLLVWCCLEYSSLDPSDFQDGPRQRRKQWKLEMEIVNKLHSKRVKLPQNLKVAMLPLRIKRLHHLPQLRRVMILKIHRKRVILLRLQS